MDLTIKIKTYHTKKRLEVKLHDIRKNTNPISQKNGSRLFEMLDLKYGHVEFFQNLLDNVPLGGT